MDETLYISRVGDGEDISLTEWLDVVEKDNTLNINTTHVIKNPETGEIINIPAKEGDVSFKYKEGEVYYLYSNGSIEFSGNLLNNTLTKNKTFLIAETLNAKVESIDGKEYFNNSNSINWYGIVFFILLFIFLLLFILKNK